MGAAIGARVGSATHTDRWVPAFKPRMAIAAYHPERLAASLSRRQRVPLWSVALILVVDDEPGVRSHVCQVLEDAGHRTVAAASAHEAREVLALAHPDLIILDLRLPDLSGLELSLQIQPSYPRLPVLFISKYPDDLSREGISHWPVRYAILPKPYSVPKLLRSVRELLSASQNPPV